MNKQELQELKKQVEETLAKVEKALSEMKIVRWQPEINEIYYYLNSLGNICHKIWVNDGEDLFRFNTGNCFKTEKEADDYRENLLTKQALKDLALELNDGVDVIWDNVDQRKYVVYFDSSKNVMNMSEVHWTLDMGQICCLNENFLSLARERIGEEKLIKLIKSGV